ncbi:MAG: DUF262 domain-containing protein [Vampirovibrio sp.]
MKFESVKISDYLKDVENYLIPDLQRGYVWKEKQVAKLFDSLLRGLPIVSLLLWEFPEGNTDFEFTRIKNSQDQDIQTNKASSKNLIVLDGQQRLTSLNLLLKSGIWKESKQFYVNLLGSVEISF